MKYTLSITLLLTLILQICSAQKVPIKDRKRTDLIYHLPSGFKEVVGPDTVFWGKEIITRIDYKIKPRNTDIFLAMCFYDLDGAGWTQQGPTLDYNNMDRMTRLRLSIGLPSTSKEEKKTIEINLDTNKITFFNQTELKKYGATYGGVVDIPMDRPYWKQYKMLRLVFFFNKGEGQVYQYYFYNDSALLDKIMDDSKYILTFKE